ncbi:hypothetical protein EDB83DRAFT_2320858 [Lactarius deliciosus]|nr:hypothetical protein EDB83DRAFT_2320858 [Lactarius deliciosus]
MEPGPFLLAHAISEIWPNHRISFTISLESSIRNKIAEKAQRAYAPSFASTKIFVNTSNVHFAAYTSLTGETPHALALVLVGVESCRLNLIFSANQCIKDDNQWALGCWRWP